MFIQMGKVVSDKWDCSLKGMNIIDRIIWLTYISWLILLNDYESN